MYTKYKIINIWSIKPNNNNTNFNLLTIYKKIEETLRKYISFQS